MKMGNMDSSRLARTGGEDEELGVALGAGIEPAVGPDVGVGVQSLEVGEGVVGVVGEGAGKGELEVAETVMANLWPSSQCRPIVQM